MKYEDNLHIYCSNPKEIDIKCKHQNSVCIINILSNCLNNFYSKGFGGGSHFFERSVVRRLSPFPLPDLICNFYAKCTQHAQLSPVTSLTDSCSQKITSRFVRIELATFIGKGRRLISRLSPCMLAKNVK